MRLEENRPWITHFLRRSSRGASIHKNAPTCWHNFFWYAGVRSPSGCIDVPLACENCVGRELGADETMDTTWDNMPLATGDLEAARVPVLVQTRVWRKIGEKHIPDPRQPWTGWLGAPVTAAFQGLWPFGCRTDADREIVHCVSNRVRDDAVTALEAPLLMRYRYSQMGAASGGGGGSARPIGSISSPEPSQRLVLPCGARVEIRRSATGSWSMRTCYFDDDVAGQDVPYWLRYRQLVGKLRGRYLVAPGVPDAETRDPYFKDDSIENGIEFVSRYNWGLEASNPPDPWNHLPAPWPQPPVLPDAPPLGLLRPPLPGGGMTK